MVEWFALTEGSAIPSSAPLFSVPKGREGLEWDVLTRDVVTLLMKGAAVDCGVDTALVSTHSIRISGATALLLAGVAPEVVQIIGRWARRVHWIHAVSGGADERGGDAHVHHSLRGAAQGRVARADWF